MTVRGKSFPVPGKGCPSATPTPTPTNTQPTGFPTSDGVAVADDHHNRDADVNRHEHRDGHADQPPRPRRRARGGNTANTASGVKAGMAVGGVLAALLPGSLLWTTASRRRRKRGARQPLAGSLR